MPPGGAYLWDVFWELEETRQAGWGALSFTYQEIDAYCRTMDVRLRPWEVRIILAMDRARRAAFPKPDDPERPTVTRLASASDVDAFERAFDRFGTVIDA
ncbi:phage tail assembly chaperone [Methylobacterium nodulans]|uniref:Uncharacterized protein n=1 Tax=Methylobacterium nodulans (strain LMG 21967 / CNCM I-2342 / ORS 2060) TaxID=460265 RepID=B8INT2_METNO|nr:hypothetical protein [Methylobacterium nodulans]ACL58448.1 hypothetical protein Mnod_3538 [Methylobacterium nodulans ORS 2060]